MAAGYGPEETSTDTDPSTGQSIAGAIAQIFSTGVTAYVDSQAIQNGYQVNDPRYYQSGYPGGVSLPYGGLQAGRGVSVAASANNSTLMLLALVGIAVYLLVK